MVGNNKLGQFNKKIGQAVVRFFRRRDPAELFVAVMAISFIVYGVVYLCIGNGRFSDMFFLRSGDLFMDFFNSMRDAWQGEGVYTERKVIYPPLANLIFLVIAQIAPHGYNNTAFDDRKEWINYSSSIFLVCVFAIICSLIVYTIFRESLKKGRVLCCLFGFFAVFNSSTLYMIERGNILILCLITLALFGFTYNSEKKAVREVSNVALAVAIALKFYPALFLWIFLMDKRYKDLLKCIVYVVILTILPSFFFGGPECLITLMKNMFSFSSKKVSTTSAVAVIREFIKLPQEFFSIGSYLWCFICMLSFMSSAALKDEKWKLWVKGIILILTAPPLTSQYVWAFFLIPIVLFSNSRPMKRRDIPMLTVLFVPFIFFLFRFNYYITVNTLLTYVCTALLSFVCLADTIILIVKTLKEKRSVQ